MRALPLLAIVLVSACSSKEEAPATTTTDTGVADTTTTIVDTGVADTGTDTMADAPVDTNFPDPFTACTKDPGPGTLPAPMSDGGGDPTGGADKFTLEMALAGYPTTAMGTLKAAITTEHGVIVCTLDEKLAPVTVANFVGLARGTRPVMAGGAWTLKRFYDGLKWHRVISGFVIQGGDPKGTGSGGPGYDIPVENHIKEPLGTLAMAGSSPTSPSGSQFYVVIGTGPAADYNVFGKCDVEVAQAIGDVETNAKAAPVVPVHMLKIAIARCP